MLSWPGALLGALFVPPWVVTGLAGRASVGQVASVLAGAAIAFLSIAYFRLSPPISWLWFLAAGYVAGAIFEVARVFALLNTVEERMTSESPEISFLGGIRNAIWGWWLCAAASLGYLALSG